MAQHPSSDNFRQNSTSRRLIWWLLGILGAILVAGGARSIGVDFDHAQRLSHLEAEMQEFREAVHRIDEAAKRIDEKLNRLVERRQ